MSRVTHYYLLCAWNVYACMSCGGHMKEEEVNRPFNWAFFSFKSIFLNAWFIGINARSKDNTIFGAIAREDLMQNKSNVARNASRWNGSQLSKKMWERENVALHIDNVTRIQQFARYWCGKYLFYALIVSSLHCVISTNSRRNFKNINSR
jgi:hypothetical protein